jgi:hypothetical protein
VPSLAYRDAASAIVLKSVARRVIAAAVHAIPNPILRCLCHVRILWEEHEEVNLCR